MVCKYSGYTWSILTGMIVTGSARSIIVKLAYQSGFEAPLTITLLYLFGQSLSLLVYRLQQCLSNDYTALDSENGEHRLQRQSAAVQEISIAECSGSSSAYSKVDVHTAAEESFQSTATKEQSSCEREPNYDDDESSSSASDTRQYAEPSTAVSSMIEMCTYNIEEEMPNGSNHGLSPQSEQRIQHKAQYIPYYIRPAIPAVFNLLNSALRWASLVFIDASVSEMLISGLELILSVMAARIIRKRIVSKSRWVGVVIVAVGVIIIERANSWKHQQKHSLEEQQSDYNDTNENAASSDENDAMASLNNNNNNNNRSSAHNVTIGVTLIILQSILSVLQDLLEEIFMQATTFPAMKMLGLEGLYGFFIGLIIYSTIANKFGIEDIDNTISMVTHTPALRWWLLGLPFLFLLTGIFNIKATEVTSAMTRNVWKNLRTVLIWIIALCIYYLGDNIDYGEAWHVPESFYILSGFLIMTCGIVAYYWHKSLEI